jgi:polyisoprenyl-phosphate glycosyltransferase
MKKLSIVIPCYNESKNIPLILQKFESVLGNIDIEVVLVDNGSYDDTPQVLQENVAKYSFARTIKVEKNCGYGFGILAGLKQATGNFLGWTHADLQTDPADVVAAYKMLEKKHWPEDLYVKGCRSGRSLFDLFFTVGMSCFESVFLRKLFWDINAQPNIFHKSFFEKWNNPPHDFSLDLYAVFMAKSMNLKFVRFNVLFTKRLYGEASNASLKNKMKLIKRTLVFSNKLKKELKDGADCS